MNSKKIIGFALGPIGAALLGALTVPLLTWFFKAEDIGKLAMLQIAISFVLVFFSLGLDQAFVREYHESKNKPLLIKSSILPGTILLLISLLVVIVADGRLMSRVVFSVSDVSLSFMLGAASISAFMSRFLSLILRMEEKGFLFSMSQLLPKLIFPSAILFGYVFSVDLDLRFLLWSQALSIFFVAIIYTYNTRSVWAPGVFLKLDIVEVVGMLRFGLPLVFGGLAFWLLQSIDRVLLRGLSSFHELGVYSVAVSVAASVGLLTTIFTTIWTPIVYRWVADGRDLSIIDEVLKSAVSVLVLIIGAAGLCSNLLVFLLPAEYGDVKYMILPLMMGPLLYGLSEISAIGLGISRKSIFSMIASVLTAISSIVISYILIARYDAVGASIGVAVSFLVFLVLRSELSCVVWRQVKRVRMYFISILLVSLTSLYSFFGESMQGVFVLIWLALVIYGGLNLRSIIGQFMCIILNKVTSLSAPPPNTNL